MAARELEDLTAVSRKLNANSDTLNKTIASIQSKLKSLNIGLEVWLDQDSSVESTHAYSTYAPTDRYEQYPIPTRDVTLLGYACINSDWVLAVKNVTLVREVDGLGQEYERVTDSTGPRPLLQASRAVRIKAMTVIPGLLSAIRSEAKNAVQSIEEAAEAAEKM